MNERMLPIDPEILKRDNDSANSLTGNHLLMIKVKATLKIGPDNVIITVPSSTQRKLLFIIDISLSQVPQSTIEMPILKTVAQFTLLYIHMLVKLMGKQTK